VQRKCGRIIPWVFHDNEGNPLFGADHRPKRSFRRAWRLACKLAGLPGRIPHDFRRTAVRNFERGGVPRAVAMALVGHKTESIYRRYDIVAESDLTQGVKKLSAYLTGTVSGTATSPKSGNDAN
jgi:integrase